MQPWKLFKALACESRIKILEKLLSGNQLCVTDLSKVLGKEKSTISRHLRYLKKVGLIEISKKDKILCLKIKKKDKIKKLLELAKRW